MNIFASETGADAALPIARAGLQSPTKIAQKIIRARACAQEAAISIFFLLFCVSFRNIILVLSAQPQTQIARFLNTRDRAALRSPRLSETFFLLNASTRVLLGIASGVRSLLSSRYARRTFNTTGSKQISFRPPVLIRERVNGSLESTGEPLYQSSQNFKPKPSFTRRRCRDVNFPGAARRPCANRALSSLAQPDTSLFSPPLERILFHAVSSLLRCCMDTSLGASSCSSGVGRNKNVYALLPLRRPGIRATMHNAARWTGRIGSLRIYRIRRSRGGASTGAPASSPTRSGAQCDDKIRRRKGADKAMTCYRCAIR